MKRGGQMRWCDEEEECGRQDSGDYTSYYCLCHLFSLTLGTFAMETTHSRPIGGDLGVRAFPVAPMMKMTRIEGGRSPLMRWLLHFSWKSSRLSYSLLLSAVSSCLINPAFSRLCDGTAALFDYANWPVGPCKSRVSISRKSGCNVRAHEEAPA